eukprot:GFYU01007932.1.p1 GENE.GFYU01007932.1~~GFYU01007932.1.p1  ORF type:complete len:467 (+),score=101.74 GFYU01007932.1:113-1513(+)
MSMHTRMLSLAARTRGGGALFTSLTHGCAKPSLLTARTLTLITTRAATTTTINYDAFLTDVSRQRQPSAIRDLHPLMNIPNMISLGAGVPNPSTFPIKSMTITLSDGSVLELDEKTTATGLQYAETPGIAPLQEWIRNCIDRYHKPSGEYSICVTNGSQDGQDKAFQMLVNPGDTILVENPTYSGALAALNPMNCNLLGIDTDDKGMNVDKLSKTLRNWDTCLQGAKPKVIYVIPNGSNPTGFTYSLERRQQIYAVAREHNLIIMEDDPYYFLQFSDFLPSFMSMDEDGRVLRFDSFSKILSSGIRLGWVSGSPALLDRIKLHMQSSTLHANAFSQVVVSSILQQWGQQGWDNQVTNTIDFYRTRRDKCLEAAERHLRGLAEWSTPTAGMFLWFKVHGVRDTRDMIMSGAHEHKVLFVPGTGFNPIVGGESSYLRASYSVAKEEDFDVAFERLAGMIRKQQEAEGQ